MHTDSKPDQVQSHTYLNKNENEICISYTEKLLKNYDNMNLFSNMNNCEKNESENLNNIDEGSDYNKDYKQINKTQNIDKKKKYSQIMSKINDVFYSINSNIKSKNIKFFPLKKQVNNTYKSSSFKLYDPNKANVTNYLKYDINIKNIYNSKRDQIKFSKTLNSSSKLKSVFDDLIKMTNSHTMQIKKLNK
jgi:hypothetical protein